MNWYKYHIGDVFYEIAYSERFLKKFKKYLYNRYKDDTIISPTNWKRYQINTVFLMDGIR